MLYLSCTILKLYQVLNIFIILTLYGTLSQFRKMGLINHIIIIIIIIIYFLLLIIIINSCLTKVQMNGNKQVDYLQNMCFCLQNQQFCLQNLLFLLAEFVFFSCRNPRGLNYCVSMIIISYLVIIVIPIYIDMYEKNLLFYFNHVSITSCHVSVKLE